MSRTADQGEAWTTGGIHVTDDRDPLWRRLQAVLAEADPVPPEVLRAARDALAELPTDPGPTEAGPR
jgi:hypothetical protein